MAARCPRCGWLSPHLPGLGDVVCCPRCGWRDPPAAAGADLPFPPAPRPPGSAP